MDLYRATFVASLCVNSLVFIRSCRTRKTSGEEVSEKLEHQARDIDGHRLRLFKWRFLPIYLLVNGADWLQGPYIYPIYKDEKGLPETLVAALFLVGFLSGGVSASFVGALADRCGRRAACLAYCVIYALSCLTLLVDYIPLLFAGRVLGGISATLLYSVFESWMVAEFNRLLPDEPGSTLSDIFSSMTMLNSLVAIIAGIIAEWVFRVFGTAKAPFLTATACLAMAFMAISRLWGENYGLSAHGEDGMPETAALLGDQQDSEPKTTRSVLATIAQDSKILCLALASCVFEGSLFLFIFFKFPALTFSHNLAGSSSDLPFGLIFAILMCSMMFGSMIYNNISTSSSSISSSCILSCSLAIAALAFFIPTRIRDERVTLWCFCAFEICCGLYYPSMAYLKGKLIEDGSRATVYGILRIPLNIFVVAALSTTKEGMGHRDLVFTTCSMLLLLGAVVVRKYLS
ncbi:DUF791-domain-containing protein, partial [Polyplosphaeria fusca]